MKKQYLKFIYFLFIVLLPTSTLAQQMTFFDLNMNMLQSMNDVLNKRLSGISSVDAYQSDLKNLKVDYIKKVSQMVSIRGLKSLSLSTSQCLTIKKLLETHFPTTESIGFCFLFAFAFSVATSFFVLAIYLGVMIPALGGICMIGSILSFLFGIYSIFECIAA